MCRLRPVRVLVISVIWAALPGIIFISSTEAQSVPELMDNTPGAHWNSDACSGFRILFNNKPLSEYKKFTREEALRLAGEVQTSQPDWKKYLPCCPENIDLVNNRDWVIANTCLGVDLRECFHLNALNCVRSKNFSGKDEHGQQCCYDLRGDLIRRGSAAGTPDYFSPNCPFAGPHEKYDVWTWTKLSLNEYHAVWTPNQGCNSAFRVKVRGTIDWTNAHLWVRKGDVIRFSDAKGTVVWGENGSSSGPSGLEVIKESLFSFATDLPRIIAPPGSLIAMIYLGGIPEQETYRLAEELQTKPFLVGRGADYEMLKDGLLFLGVNDVNPANNSGSFDVELRRMR